MRVFITGIDGYLGWTLAQHLAENNHEIGGADKYYRRKWVAEMGSDSAIPIASMDDRRQVFHEHYHEELKFYEGDLLDYAFVRSCIQDFQPDAIVHLGECPSAPYSMIDVHHATWVQQNNVMGTLNLLYAMHEIAPQSHLVKLGTMGEYGTPNLNIPEGFFTIEYQGRKDTLPFPRQAGSWYHWSKVHDSNNVMFACKVMGLRSTDIMQGVVFGTRIASMEKDLRLTTRLDFDQAFGTVINRFCCQAIIDHPLTPFGKGDQKRAFLPLKDVMQCLSIAISNPPQSGHYRVFNQFAHTYSVNELAQLVQNVAKELEIETTIRRIENPRVEQEEHHYNPCHDQLLELGYQPSEDIKQDVKNMLEDLSKHKEHIAKYQEVLIPDIRWDGSKHRSNFIGRE